MMRTASCLAVAGLVLSLSGCAEVQPESAQAQAGSPVSAQVEIVNVPYDGSLPKYVVVVEPFAYGAAGVTSGGGAVPTAPGANSGVGGIVGSGLKDGSLAGGAHGTSEPVSPIGGGVAAQLTTALTHAGNISVATAGTIQAKDDGTYETKLGEGEVGPFIIRGTVTEFNETAELNEKKRGGGLGTLGAGVGLLGAATGHSTVAATGAGVAIANPTYENQQAKRKGMVGMDIQLVDGRTGRIIRGYNASGTFTTVSATSGMSVFGIGGGDAAFASSALGQATRAAMNQAVTSTMDALKTTK